MNVQLCAENVWLCVRNVRLYAGDVRLGLRNARLYGKECTLSTDHGMYDLFREYCIRLSVGNVRLCFAASAEERQP